MADLRTTLFTILFATVVGTTIITFLPVESLRGRVSEPFPSNQPGAIQSELEKYAEVIAALKTEIREAKEGRRTMSAIQQQLGELIASGRTPPPSPAPATEPPTTANAKELEAIQKELVKYAEALKTLRTEIQQLGDGRKAELPTALATIQEQLGALRAALATASPQVALPVAATSPSGTLNALLGLYAPVKSMQQLYAASAGEAICKLLILGLVENKVKVENGTESLEDAIRRIGVDVLSATLHRRCTSSPYWRAKHATVQLPAAVDRLASELRGLQQTVHPHEDNARHWLDMPPDLLPARTVLPQTFVDVAETPRALLAEASGADPSCPDNLCRRVPVANRTYANLSAYSVTWHLPPAGNGTANRTLRFFATTFAIAKGLVRDRVSRLKLFPVSPAFPRWIGQDPENVDPRQGRPHYDLDHTGEYTSYQVYHHSKFCYGMFRSAPDRQGHTEMLSQGCVLYVADYFGPFSNDPKRNPSTDARFKLLGYPRYLMMEATRMPGLEAWSANDFKNEYFWHSSHYNVRKLPPIDMSRFNTTRYFEIADAMLDFTRKHLTCGANMAHVLRTIGYEEPKKVLLLVPEFDDYQSLAVECGMDELGLNYVTNLITHEQRQHWPSWQKPSPDELRRFLVDPQDGSPRRRLSLSRHDWQNIEWTHHALMYGLGFAWGAKIEEPPHPRVAASDLIPRIHSGEFDLVVVSNWWLLNEGRFSETADIFDLAPVLEAVREHFTAHGRLNRVVFFEGGDGPRCPCHYEPKLVEMLAGGSSVFVRELTALFDALAFHGKQGVVELDAGAEGRFTRKPGG